MVELGREVDECDLIICRDTLLDSSKPQIRVPQAEHDGNLHPKDCGGGVIELPIDLVSRCSERFDAVMNPEVALMYKLATRMPFSYRVIPSSIRNRLLRTNDIDMNLLDHLAIETARRIIAEAFNALGFRLQRKNPPSLLITHDIETQKGLGKALRFKEIEDDLGVQSTWFLSPGEYSISRSLAKDLGSSSTIGSHDLKHDGRLISIRNHGRLVERLVESKKKLEDLFESNVTCFRSPLLQFGRSIISALCEAGYEFDYSLPCWEPVYPLTMTGFGIESVQQFAIHGIIETPLTLFQDHQIFNVLGMSIYEGIRLWLDQAKLVRSLDGNIVLLIHPDYAFSRNLPAYRQLLIALLELHVNFDSRLIRLGPHEVEKRTCLSHTTRIES